MAATTKFVPNCVTSLFSRDNHRTRNKMSVSSFEVNAAAAMRDYYVEPRLGLFLR